MGQATKDEARRERVREYEAALTAAGAPVAVLSMFAQGREARAGGQLLEEAFSSTKPDGIEDATPLPAAVWVALRQGDIEATVDALVRLSRTDFLLGAHEELDASYRLTTVEERRGMPDVELLEAQMAAFLQVPRDVVTIIASWGADDPRTVAEIETLLDQRFGSTVPGAVQPMVRRHPVTENSASTDGSDDTASSDGEQTQLALPALGASLAATDGEAGLMMSSGEFSALLSLTPEQGAVLATLVRQTAITIGVEPPHHKR